MTHLILVGACYLDTILSVPHYPEQDSKLRATSLAVRRGGNCPNTLEVLEQLLAARQGGGDDAGRRDIRTYLVSPLPRQSSPATRRILASFATRPRADFSYCLYRQDCTEPASSYIIRSEATGSRTIVNYNDLPEMTAREFEGVASRFDSACETWWHFEGRIPDTTLACIRLLRTKLPAARISVEVEKPGRPGLPELAAEADVVFYSRTWAENPCMHMPALLKKHRQSRGHRSAEACLKVEHRRQGSVGLCTWGADGAAALSQPLGECHHFPVRHQPRDIAVVDAIGAGDTFIAGMLFGLVVHRASWDLNQCVRFAVDLATLKVQREGFAGLGTDMAALS